MKRRIKPILTIAAALVLFSGIVYAMERKKQSLPADRSQLPTREEEMLKTELLEATGEHEEKSPGIEKINNAPLAGNNAQIARQPKVVTQFIPDNQ